MPVREYRCGVCGMEAELLLSMDAFSPLCCGVPMIWKPSASVKINIKDGKTNRHSEGYKKDYASDYRRRLQEAKS